MPIKIITPDLKDDRRVPIYHRLREEFLSKIVNQEWKPLEPLPSELSLAEIYGTAPGTVRKAIGTLVNEGFLERHQGKGTFVRKASFDSSLLRFFKFQPDSGELVIPKSIIMKREVLQADANIANKLQIKKGTAVINMHRQRCISGEPVIIQDIWLPLSKFKKLLEIKAEEMGDMLYPVYEEKCGHVIAMAKEELRAEAVNKKYAKLLNIPTGSPIIVIERSAFGFDHKILEWRRSFGRADKYHYSVEIR